MLKLDPYLDNGRIAFLDNTLTINDQMINTTSGDIVLFEGNKIIIFYGNYTGSYTLLGHLNISRSELSELLTEDEVELKLEIENK